jgi:hypothetical protein
VSAVKRMCSGVMSLGMMCIACRERPATAAQRIAFEIRGGTSEGSTSHFCVSRSRVSSWPCGQNSVAATADQR